MGLELPDTGPGYVLYLGMGLFHTNFGTSAMVEPVIYKEIAGQASYGALRRARLVSVDPCRRREGEFRAKVSVGLLVLTR